MCAAVTMLIGIAPATGGIWRIALGGSPYYLVSGSAYTVGGLLLWRDLIAGAWIIAGVFALTILWAVAEAGLTFWPLFPRLVMPAGPTAVALLLALPMATGKTSRQRPVMLATAGTSAVVSSPCLG